MSLRPKLPSAGALCFWIHIIFASSIVASALEFRPDARHITLKPFEVPMHDTKDFMKSREATFTANSPDPPRMLVAEGCDGSTATLVHAINILAVHGIDAGDPHAQKELLHKPRNRFITTSNDDIVTAMQLMKKQRQEQNKSLVFKSILQRDINATINPGLVNLGTLAVYSTRRNTLDKLVCMIRDCFVDTDATTTKYGYPVDEHGQPDDMCFEGNHSKTFKALIRTDQLAKNLARLEKQEVKNLEMLHNAGYNVAHTKYEDVLAFEKGGSENIETSAQAWSAILASWEVPVSNENLWKYLESQDGTYSPPGQHENIYNFGEVVYELVKLGRKDLINDAAFESSQDDPFF